jgi:hypothetical protein
MAAWECCFGWGAGISGGANTPPTGMSGITKQEWSLACLPCVPCSTFERCQCCGEAMPAPAFHVRVVRQQCGVCFVSDRVWPEGCRCCAFQGHALLQEDADAEGPGPPDDRRPKGCCAMQ